MKTIISNIFLLFLYPSILVADTIYKSVDEDGNVTYSTTAVQDSEQSTKVDIMPPPSEESIEAAQDLQERYEKTADTMGEDRKKRNEIIAEENRLKRENEKLLQQEPAEQNNYYLDYEDDYLDDRSRYPGVIRPPVQRPPMQRPPSRPAPK